MENNKYRNEISYYNEIQRFISDQINSNFNAKHRQELSVFWGIGELKNNLQKMIQEHPKECNCVKEFANRVPPLNLDIFALITNGEFFQILILEVKLRNNVGLKEWSQLIGYCLVSDAKYGLLININNGASQRLSQILSSEQHLSNINTIFNDKNHRHYLGFMQWDGLTKSFDYSNLGLIKSLSDLTYLLGNDFNKKDKLEDDGYTLKRGEANPAIQSRKKSSVPLCFPWASAFACARRICRESRTSF